MLGNIVTAALEDLAIHRDDNACFTSVVTPDKLDSDSRAQICKRLHNLGYYSYLKSSQNAEYFYTGY